MKEVWRNRLFYIGFVVLVACVFFLLGSEVNIHPGQADYNRPVQSFKSSSTSATTTATATVNATTSTGEISAPKIPINSATVEELMRIPGIGVVFAQRILEYRELLGGFTDLSQLLEVEGIGQVRYSQWSPYFTLD